MQEQFLWGMLNQAIKRFSSNDLYLLRLWGVGKGRRTKMFNNTTCNFINDSTSISSVQAVCYEFAVEMTYPLSEGVSAGLINFTSQVWP